MQTFSPADILEFWFGTEADDAAVAKAQAPLWWSKNEEIDAAMRVRFAPLLASVAAGELDAWQATAEGLLALILATDQFPRNIHRGTPAAFGFDAIARRYARMCLDTRLDRRLRPVQRVFVYLPLEHAECAADQAQCVVLFEELAAEASAALKTVMAGYLDYAVRHKAIIDRFGRFPHRNAILGRPSTPEELDFLRQPGSSF